VLRIHATEVMDELVILVGRDFGHANVEPLAMSAVAARIDCSHRACPRWCLIRFSDPKHEPPTPHP
jgi:hypothetical protein